MKNFFTNGQNLETLKPMALSFYKDLNLPPYKKTVNRGETLTNLSSSHISGDEQYLIKVERDYDDLNAMYLVNYKTERLKNEIYFIPQKEVRVEHPFTSLISLNLRFLNNETFALVSSINQVKDVDLYKVSTLEKIDSIKTLSASSHIRDIININPHLNVFIISELKNQEKKFKVQLRNNANKILQQYQLRHNPTDLNTVILSTHLSDGNLFILHNNEYDIINAIKGIKVASGKLDFCMVMRRIIAVPGRPNLIAGVTQRELILYDLKSKKIVLKSAIPQASTYSEAHFFSTLASFIEDAPSLTKKIDKAIQPNL